MNEDLLEASLSVLKSKVDVIMFDINNMMSTSSYCDNMAKKLASKISKLAKANQSYQQAISLKAQMMAMKIATLQSIEESTKPEESKEKE
jgi:hypothetical protein